MAPSYERQCPVCLAWFMTRRQRDHHMTLRHPLVRWAPPAGHFIFDRDMMGQQILRWVP